MARLPDSARSKICGYASIDYRLSAHQDAISSAASEAGGRESMDIRHPDHILDVRAALEYLDSQVQIQDGYVLIGHSAGATLAYQVLMGVVALAGQPATAKVPLPAAVIGISGIYDIPGLVERNVDIPAYYNFVSGAFGKERSSWTAASPARFTGSFTDAWSGLSILAHSPDDSLVDAAETKAMARRLRLEEMHVETVYDLSGEHDVVWQEGSQLARLVVRAIQCLG